MQELEGAKGRLHQNIDSVYTYNYIKAVPRARANFYLFSKRMLDLLVSVIALIVLSPLYLVISILVKLTSRGPVIFRQERLGLYGSSFYIYKFRSMKLDAENFGPMWAEKNDSRVTGIGRFLRLSHLDELPQLINIIKGEMSLVGPRPEREYFYNKFECYIPDFRCRLSVKPGLTGWAQINGGYDISPAKKLALDKQYLHNCSFFKDLEILVRTVKIVFQRSGAR